MYARDVAIEAAVAGVPFRDAYKQAADAASEAGQGRTPESSLAARVSPGASADPRLNVLLGRLAQASEPLLPALKAKPLATSPLFTTLIRATDHDLDALEALVGAAERAPEKNGEAEAVKDAVLAMAANDGQRRFKP